MKKHILKVWMILAISFLAMDVAGQGPLVVSLNPGNLATGVSVEGNLTIVFDQSIQFNPSSDVYYVDVYEVGGRRDFLLYYSEVSLGSGENMVISGSELILSLPISLNYSKDYYVLVEADAIQTLGGIGFSGITSANEWSFTTEAEPLELTLKSPTDGATDVPLTQSLVATFNQNIQFAAGGASVSIFSYSDDVLFETLTDVAGLSITGMELTINPTTDFAEGTRYYVTIPAAAIETTTGAPFSGVTLKDDWDFTTVYLPLTPPTLSPIDGDTGVPRNAILEVTFDKDIEFGIGGTVEIFNGATQEKVFTKSTPGVSIVTNNTLRIDLSAIPLVEYGTLYDVRISSGFIKRAGINIDFAGFTAGEWSFTTEALPLELTLKSPVDGDTGVTLNQSLVATFNQNIQLAAGAEVYLRTYVGDTPVETLTALSGLSVLGMELTINPTADFSEGTRYYVIIPAGAIETTSTPATIFSGVTLKDDWDFNTEYLPPSVLNYSPAPGALEVPLNSVLTLTFDEDIVLGSNGDLRIKYGTTDGKIFSVNSTDEISVLGSQLTIDLSANALKNYGTLYHVIIDPGFVKSSTTGEDFGGISSSAEWYFTTEGSPPIWATGYPSIQNQNSSAFDLVGQLDQAGTYYYVVSDNGTQLDHATISNAINEPNNGGFLIAGNNSMTSNTPFSSTLSTSVFEVPRVYYLFVYGASEGKNSEIIRLEIDRFPPRLQLLGTYPSAGYSVMPVNDAIVLNFSKKLYAVDNENLIEITQANVGNYIQLIEVFGGLPIDVTITIGPEGRLYTITPVSALSEATSYKVVIGTVSDVNGNVAVIPDHTFSTDKQQVWAGGGADPSIWGDIANWSTGTYVTGKSVTIPSVLANYPVITTGTIDVHNLTIEPGALLTHTAGTLNVSGIFTLKSSDLYNASYIPGGTLGITGDRVRVEQVIPNPSVAYMISSPTDNSTTSNIQTTGPLYYYSNATDTWELLGSGPMTLGSGYWMWTSQSPLVFSGNINDSNVNVPVSYTPGQGYGWNLVGNPYTAGLDWSTVTLPATVENNMWIWHPNEKKYGSLSAASSVFINLESPIIPSNHGFLVRVVEPVGGGSLTTSFDITPSSIVAEKQSNTYLKSSTASSFEFFKIAGIKNNMRDETAIVFAEDASDGKDKYDAQKYFSNSAEILELFTLSNSSRTGINAIPFEDYKEIVLGYRASKVGNYSIELVKNSTLDKKVILIDKLAGNEVDLNEVEEYRFDLASSGFNTSRFALRFVSTSPGVVTSDKLKTNIDTIDFKVFAQDKQVYIKVNENLKDFDFRLYDISGRMIKSGQFNGGLSISIGSFSEGTYVVEVYHSDFPTIIKQKVVVY